MLALINAICLHGATGANLMTSVLLHDPDPLGARCLDGSPPRIWIRAAGGEVNSSKWAWHFQGGGWCETEDACADRAFSPTRCMLGSSREECFDNNGCHVQNFRSVMDYVDLPAVNGARWVRKWIIYYICISWQLDYFVLHIFLWCVDAWEYAVLLLNATVELICL